MAASQQQQQEQNQDRNRNSRQKKDPPGWNSSTHLSVKSDKDNLANNDSKKDVDDTLDVLGIVVGGDKPSSKSSYHDNKSQEDSYPLLSSVGIDSRSSDDVVDDDDDDDSGDSGSEPDSSDFDSSDDEDEDYHGSMKMLEEMLMDEEHRRRSRSVSSMPELTSSKSSISMTSATRKEGSKIQSRKQNRQEAVSDVSDKKGMASSMADLSAALAKFELRRSGSDKCLQDPTWNESSVPSSIKKQSGGIHSGGSSHSLGDLFQTKPSARSLVANSSKDRSSSKGKSSSSKGKSPSSDSDLLKPEDCLKSILNKSCSSGARYEPVGAGTAPEGFFVPLAKKDFDDFSNDISAAVRTGDIRFLKAHLKSGKSPHCCNKFRESIVHTICRRGNEELLSCILKYEQWQDQGEEGEGRPPISLRVVDDQNRTCLHDAAWTHKPNFRVVKILIDACPDLLLVKDQRGFTPLAYVGRNQYSAWNAFLRENEDLLTPKLLSPIKAT